MVLGGRGMHAAMPLVKHNSKKSLICKAVYTQADIHLRYCKHCEPDSG